MTGYSALLRTADILIGLLRLLGRVLGPLGNPVTYLAAGLRYRIGFERDPRILVPARWMAAGTRSSRNLEELTAGMAPPRYLEIGVFDGTTLEAVRTSRSIGVDPAPRIRAGVTTPRGIDLHRVPSDDYFADLDARDPEATFDVVFVDGLHEFRQAYRDIANALRRLRRGGLVLVDDVVPPDATAAGPDMPARGPWTGDVFRAVLALAPQSDVLDWRTFERPAERFQTVLWRTGDWPGPVGDEVLDGLAAVTYEEVFRDGVPEAFRPCAFAEAVAAYRAGVAARA